MFRFGAMLLAGLMVWVTAGCGDSRNGADRDAEARTVAVLTTSEGDLILRLRFDTAPANARNFQKLCEAGSFDNTTFHRVAPGYLIQGGDPNTLDEDPENDGYGGSSWDGLPLPLEPGALEARRGAVATAGAGPSAATGSQFFILLADDPGLEQRYSFFAELEAGLDIADQIADREGEPYPPGLGGFRPHRPIVIESCRTRVPTPEPGDAEPDAGEPREALEPPETS